MFFDENLLIDSVSAGDGIRTEKKRGVQNIEKSKPAESFLEDGGGEDNLLKVYSPKSYFATAPIISLLYTVMLASAAKAGIL